MTAKQKADRARAQAMIEALKAQGLAMPAAGEKKAPRPGTRVRNKKSQSSADQGMLMSLQIGCGGVSGN